VIIKYGVSGTRRKELAQAVSALLEESLFYKGMPTTNYQVGEYIINMQGIVRGPDNRALVADLLGCYGFEAISKEYDAQLPEPEETPADEASSTTEEPEPEQEEAAAVEQDVSESEIPETLTYQAELSDPAYPDRLEIISAESDEDAIRQARDFCTDEILLLELHLMNDKHEVVRSVAVPPASMTIQMPKAGFDPAKLENLTRLVNAKEQLIKAAIGADSLPIRMMDETLDFDWFAYTTDQDTINAYATLCAKLCSTAQQKQRITAKPHEILNPKYELRCFLVSIGFVGDEFKSSRKILMKNFGGFSSAWKNGAPEKTAQEESSNA
jgi:hypothetical protein